MQQERIGFVLTTGWMPNDPSTHDLIIFLVATVLGLGAASFMTLNAWQDVPLWPVCLWLWLFRNHAITFLRRYQDTRQKFSLRGQFLASFLAWFFIFLVVGAIAFRYSYQLGC